MLFLFFSHILVFLCIVCYFCVLFVLSQEEDMNWQMMMANRHSMKATDSGDESSIIGPAGCVIYFVYRCRVVANCASTMPMSLSLCFGAIAKVGRGSFDGQYVDEGEGMGMFCDDSNRVNMHRENDYTEGNAGRYMWVCCNVYDNVTSVTCVCVSRGWV